MPTYPMLALPGSTNELRKGWSAAAASAFAVGWVGTISHVAATALHAELLPEEVEERLRVPLVRLDVDVSQAHLDTPPHNVASA
jgi:hypothetical protein